MSALHDLTVAELASRLRGRQVSALELARHLLARSQAHAGLGAFLAQDEAVTLAQARAADARLASGDAPLLTGVPVAHASALAKPATWGFFAFDLRRALAWAWCLGAQPSAEDSALGVWFTRILQTYETTHGLVKRAAIHLEENP